MQKHISADSAVPPRIVALRIVIVTLDSHLAGAVDRVRPLLTREMPGLHLSLHAAADWDDEPGALERCRADIDAAHIVIATMLFMEDHIRPVLPWLQRARERCDALVCCMSAGEVVKLTRLGRFDMSGEAKGPLALLKRLRGARKEGGNAAASSGARQMAMLRRIPKILRFIPGPAQDVRAYFLTLQYWLSGSDDNVANMLRFLVDRYADGERAHLRGHVRAAAPAEYPELGVYHPRLPGRIAARADALPGPARPVGTVGLLVMRSYVLPGNAAHYDGVIAALEAKGMKVIPAFASGLDARPAVEKFFLRDGRAVVDAVVSLTGFSLVGGPAYNDARAAEEMLATLDVPCIAAHPLEFQTLEQWQASDRGLTPVEATMMVAIPELDGATGSLVYGGRSGTAVGQGARDMRPHPERAAMLAARVAKLVALRRARAADRKVAIVLFNFPPNSGGVGTAAYLSVFASLYNTLKAMKAEGYGVHLPAGVQALRDLILSGNRDRFGTDANVAARVAVDDHVRREPYLREIEAQWGPAPGRQLSDGRALLIQGVQLGNVFVGVQPGFGYEGDPMRLLFEKGFAPTHAFSAFYRWIREDFGADAVLHFGTHGALEFMPGKQTALGAECWPDRLIGDLPNLYLYAANNPSEGAIAKRRAAATLISYLTPSIARAGLYRGLIDLKSSLDSWRGMEPDNAARADLADLIQAQAATVDLADAEPAWGPAAADRIAALTAQVLELEYTLIPHGLHVVGQPPDAAERADLLAAVAESAHGLTLPPAALAALTAGLDPAEVREIAGCGTDEVFRSLAETNALLAHDHEIPAILRALDGRYIRPAAGGDLIRTPAVLPTGRNVHGFDPYRIPSAFAVADGARQADRLLARHAAEGGGLPDSIALVLWGTDNLKSEGGPIAQALALIGAAPRFDSYGRLCGASLIPLAELGRARVDVVLTLSGIFRDLLPLQTRMLAEACWLAASAVDEPTALNPIRRHALAYAEEHGCDLETAALRVFSNADGAYGANVNHMIDSGLWQEEDELAETYSRRKCFAYGRDGRPVKAPALLDAVLADVDLAYQNLESVEVGVTGIDHYVDTLGGISRAVGRAKAVRGRSGQDAKLPVYIGDQTRGEGTVRTLGEQVALETRTRALNPKWYEAMLTHGHEGVRHIEAQVTNTLGWSATTGHVAPWVYQQLTQTFMLDPAMRERLADLNPTASARMANRLLEAQRRQYWTPNDATLAALREAGDALEDRLEGIHEGAAA